MLFCCFIFYKLFQNLLKKWQSKKSGNSVIYPHGLWMALWRKKYISKASTFWDYQSTRGAKWASTTQERRIACFFRCYTLLKWFIFFYLGSRGLFKDLNRHLTWLYEVDMFKKLWKKTINMYGVRNLEMSIRFSLKSRPSERFRRPELS